MLEPTQRGALKAKRNPTTPEAFIVLPLIRIISGGQTGADQGALIAAKYLGLETGGMAPKGFRTDEGMNLDLGRIYGLIQCTSSAYQPRTRNNVATSDGTILFGDLHSRGTHLTENLCIEFKKPAIRILWPYQEATPSIMLRTAFINWLAINNIETLNVAGNRERINPGIQQAIEDFLINTLQGRV